MGKRIPGFLVLLLPLLISCSSGGATDGGGTPDAGPPDIPTVPGIRSGSRIKPLYFLLGDGAVLFAAGLDTGLPTGPELCFPAAANDRTYRCLPQWTASRTGFYWDTECKVPLYSSTTINPPAQYVDESADGMTTIFPALRRDHMPTVYAGQPGACQPIAAPASLATRYVYQAGDAPLPADTFVQAQFAKGL